MPQRLCFRRPAWFSRAVPALGMGLVLGSCAPATNLLSPTGPVFQGRYAPHALPASAPDSTLRVVTFNIRFALEIENLPVSGWLVEVEVDAAYPQR